MLLDGIELKRCFGFGATGAQELRGLWGARERPPPAPPRRSASADWPNRQARRDSAESAAFVVADGARAPDFCPQLGTLESPERGATVVLTVTALGEGQRLRLSGAGIDGHSALAVSGWHPDWINARADWVAAFPLGVDVILCDGARFAALPRTTHIKMEVG